jgi:hypothetical protein
MNVGSSVSWQFSSVVTSDRAAKLLSWKSFDDIVEHLLACQISPMSWEAATLQRLKDGGCHRASFELIVLPDVYDAFFNAPAGYRGQFARSETHGEAANRKLLDALFLRLLAVAAEHRSTTRNFVATSLKGKQAKIWIDEQEVEEQLTDPEPSIDFPPWEFQAPDGQGLRAPRGSMLLVKGGWVSSTGEEVINLAKNHRSGNINRTGDSG